MSLEMPFNEFDNSNDEFAERRPERLPIVEVIATLQTAPDLGEDVILPAGVIYGLSDLMGDDLSTLRDAWPNIPTEQRRRTIELLTELSETNFDLDFEQLSYIAFADEDAVVRAKAVELPWYVRSVEMFRALMHLAEDPVPTVRAAALSGLGRFILDGELEEFDISLAQEAQQLAMRRYDNMQEDIEVRRRALEVISHCGNPRVGDMIHEAYYDDEVMMRVSAVFAMGSSCDQRWKDIVLKELESVEPEIRFEAIRAAGQLELTDATPHLITLAHSDDYEIQLMAIWSLGEIGSTAAREALVQLSNIAEDNGDDELAMAVDEALDMAMLMGDQFLPMFSFDDVDEDDFVFGLDEFDPDSPAALN